jgi:peptide chain release factor 2
MQPIVSSISGGSFDIANKRERAGELEVQMSDPTFWNDKETARIVVGKVSACKSIIEPFGKVADDIENFEVLAELAAEEGVESDMIAEADGEWERIQKALDRLELVSFLGNEFDKNNAIIGFNSGAGGTESCDWCNMMYRMYTRWIERRGFTAEILDLQKDEVAGIKSATVMVTGEYAYGYLQAERGVHRLVRISPFDSNKRRHTSFAALEVTPEIDDDVEVDIDDKDLRIDYYRSSGAGGQHVNVTDSAVRITHNPTGIVVTCQNERSQHKNKSTAMKVLRSKLYELQRLALQAQQRNASGPKEDNAWGSQIRSYVLHPYQMVKDLRTEQETSNTSAVLDGDLDQFIEAWLRSNRSNERQ